jgi:hypothetical protein
MLGSVCCGTANRAHGARRGVRSPPPARSPRTSLVGDRLSRHIRRCVRESSHQRRRRTAPASGAAGPGRTAPAQQSRVGRSSRCPRGTARRSGVPTGRPVAGGTCPRRYQENGSSQSIGPLSDCMLPAGFIHTPVGIDTRSSYEASFVGLVGRVLNDVLGPDTRRQLSRRTTPLDLLPKDEQP